MPEREREYRRRQSRCRWERNGASPPRAGVDAGARERAMARLFNVEVFSKTINGGGSPPYARYTSGEQFYALLGSADTIIL